MHVERRLQRSLALEEVNRRVARAQAVRSSESLARSIASSRPRKPGSCGDGCGLQRRARPSGTPPAPGRVPRAARPSARRQATLQRRPRRNRRFSSIASRSDGERLAEPLARARGRAARRRVGRTERADRRRRRRSAAGGSRTGWRSRPGARAGSAGAEPAAREQIPEVRGVMLAAAGGTRAADHRHRDSGLRSAPPAGPATALAARRPARRRHRRAASRSGRSTRASTASQ